MSKPAAIKPATQIAMRNGINMFVYGYPGIGKTPFIATGEKTLILDGDRGAGSAAGSGADVWEDVTTWEKMEEAYEFLRHSNHGYRNVWWDGVSIGQDYLLEDVMNILIRPQSEGGKGKSHRVPYLVDQGEYQENMMRIKQWIRHMIAQPFNFGVTGFPFPSFDEATDETKLWPWIQGKRMPQSVCSSFDFVVFCRRDDKGFKLYGRETEDYYARDRWSVLGPGILNPTIPQIERMVRAKLGTAASTPAKTATPAAKAAPKKIGPRPVQPRRK